MLQQFKTNDRILKTSDENLHFRFSNVFQDMSANELILKGLIKIYIFVSVMFFKICRQMIFSVSRHF